MHQAWLNKRAHEHDETLHHLAQNVEMLVKLAYPVASEEMVVVLVKVSTAADLCQMSTSRAFACVTRPS